MGAMLWQHEAPWQPDPTAALRAVQVEEFRHQYDFARELEKWRASAEQSMIAEQQSGDRFGLAAIWSKQLQTISDITSKPLPQTTEGQIESLRRVLPEGYGGILDVTGVDESGGVHVAQLLPPKKVEALFGTARPTLAAVRESLDAVTADLDRGESVAIATYDESGNPTHWVFIGLTVD